MRASLATWRDISSTSWPSPPNLPASMSANPTAIFFYVNRDTTHGSEGFRTKIITHVDGQRSTRLLFRDHDARLIDERIDPADRMTRERGPGIERRSNPTPSFGPTPISSSPPKSRASPLPVRFIRTGKAFRGRMGSNCGASSVWTSKSTSCRPLSENCASAKAAALS